VKALLIGCAVQKTMIILKQNKYELAVRPEGHPRQASSRVWLTLVNG
jgi:hypothetical protein